MFSSLPTGFSGPTGVLLKSAGHEDSWALLSGPPGAEGGTLWILRDDGAQGALVQVGRIQDGKAVFTASPGVPQGNMVFIRRSGK